MRLLMVHHERADLARRDEHYIHAFCALWAERGVEVLHRAGWAKLPEADVVLLHVDASVVPAAYARALRDHPRVWNRRCADIRKRSLPERGLVVNAPGDHAGPVIVKTDLNCAAAPELRLYRRPGGWANPLGHWRLWRASRPAKKRRDYPVYASAAEVPPEVWGDAGRVVERFLPERDGEDYVARWAYFCGAREAAFVTRAADPVVRWRAGQPEDLIPVPPAIADYARRIGLDYGKIDYVERVGRQFVLDVNKTIGGAGEAESDTPLTRWLAEGLFEWMEREPSPS